MNYFLIFSLIISSAHIGLVYGHGDEKHELAPTNEFKHDSIESKEKDIVRVDKDVYRKIDLAYQKEVKPIFENSCFNCHSNEVKYPWYYEFPIVKSMIDEDIKEARKHLLFEEGFPFKGHGDPVKDLKAIAKATIENEMPPLEYVVMHPSSYLNEKEKNKILEWTKESLELLK